MNRSGGFYANIIVQFAGNNNPAGDEGHHNGFLGE